MVSGSSPYQVITGWLAMTLHVRDQTIVLNFFTGSACYPGFESTEVKELGDRLHSRDYGRTEDISGLRRYYYFEGCTASAPGQVS